MKKVIETQRLLFRELTPSDAEVMFELDSDPAVVLYTGDKPLTHIDQARQRIDSVIQQYEEFGVGRLVAVLKETNEFIGWAGLKYIKELNSRQDNYDLGYRFMKRHWGKGYGTESAKAFIRYGFDVMKLLRISAYIDVDHVVSARILDKCGLKFTNTFMDEVDLCAWYEIVNSPSNCH
ncbi:MAG: GNAT family N-acetyltransferase [Rhodoferax sp.]|uniref:GNAT family N-acetyltransferase n=1 Tax=Rhodoferax sp. TaxID=50421 RepID=UPI001B720D5B|nr:GNAT family N-acetyltransferase [Rhodoferax sp.]MBP9907299.1 GNAT family N-acetyltransferase [Rhodoferax sp.]